MPPSGVSPTRASCSLAARNPGSCSPPIARIAHAPVSYRRAGSLHERLAPWQEVTRAARGPHSIVIDPDSRLTQLGLLPVCPEENYYFFESRAYGAGGDEPLPALAARWALETFGIEDAAP